MKALFFWILLSIGLPPAPAYSQKMQDAIPTRTTPRIQLDSLKARPKKDGATTPQASDKSPGIDCEEAECGQRLVIVKCLPTEVIGPDGKCIMP
jgi:hypothetical protein